MKLLYISSWHGTLEYDELSLFTEMNIDWFSTGFYMNPKQPIVDHAPRKPINKEPNLDLIQEFIQLNPNNKIYSVPQLNKNFVDKFDVVLVEHCCPTNLSPLQRNWDVIKHKPVVWRTYSQQTSSLELSIQNYRKNGLKLVRISPKERTIPNYAGDDAIIRGYVDENEYNNWNGEDKIVLTFNNFFNKRKVHSNTNIYMNIRQHMPGVKFELYGCDNQDVPISLGKLSWEHQKEKYRKARIYFALGSKPAALTYNLVEAMMTGCPVITWGPNLGNMKQINDWKNTYEACDIIQNGVNGFALDSDVEIEHHIKELMNNYELAKQISQNARQMAISLFGKEKIKQDWQKFLNTQT